MPDSVDRDRVARLKTFARKDLVWHINTMPPMFAASMFKKSSLSARAFVVAKEVTDAEAFNRDELRVVEMPAGNGTATARSIAQLYGRSNWQRRAGAE